MPGRCQLQGGNARGIEDFNAYEGGWSYKEEPPECCGQEKHQYGAESGEPPNRSLSVKRPLGRTLLFKQSTISKKTPTEEEHGKMKPGRKLECR